MKANFENLIKVMQICAKAHNAEFKDWSEDGQLGIAVENIPTYSDVREIFKAFYECDDRDMVEMCYGHVTLWMAEEEYFRDEVDMETLEMALPYGALKDFKGAA